jgi:ankyrin repeat protein
VCDVEGISPVAIACSEDNINISLLLLESGSNLYHIDDAGRSIIQIAAGSNQDLRSLEMLIDRGIDLLHCDPVRYSYHIEEVFIILTYICIRMVVKSFILFVNEEKTNGLTI